MRNTLQKDFGTKMNNDNICTWIGIKIYGEIFTLPDTKQLLTKEFWINFPFWQINKTNETHITIPWSQQNWCLSTLAATWRHCWNTHIKKILLNTTTREEPYYYEKVIDKVKPCMIRELIDTKFRHGQNKFGPWGNLCTLDTSKN